MKKILIIEDELAIAELEQDYLEIEGFSIDIETEATAGLEAALSNDYHLIILDIMLPGGNGFDLCKKIRSEKNIPILIVSAKSEDIDKIRGLGLGADDYVSKPFSPQELVARVKSNLNRYESLINSKNSNNIITIKHLTIDPEARRVLVKGEEVSLTNKAFDVLMLLVKNRGIVLSKEKIFEKVWDYDDNYGDLSTVAVHIRKLRKAIEITPDNPELIDTIWGAGYRFN